VVMPMAPGTAGECGRRTAPSLRAGWRREAATRRGPDRVGAPSVHDPRGCASRINVQVILRTEEPGYRRVAGDDLYRNRVSVTITFSLCHSDGHCSRPALAWPSTLNHPRPAQVSREYMFRASPTAHAKELPELTEGQQFAPRLLARDRARVGQLAGRH